MPSVVSGVPDTQERASRVPPSGGSGGVRGVSKGSNVGVKHRGNAAAKASRDAKRLKKSEFVDLTRLTADEMKRLDEIIVGNVRNAAAILKAIEFKAAYAYGKPKENTEHTGTVTVKIERNDE